MIVKGTAHVKKPNAKLRFRLSLNWLRSSSRPAVNMMYKMPIVENKLIAPELSMMPSACGPIATPHNISPMTCGMRNFCVKSGTINITPSITEKSATFFVNGSAKSSDKCS